MEPGDWFMAVFFICLGVGMVFGTILATLVIVGMIKELVDEAIKENAKRRAERERIKGKRLEGLRDWRD